jgi:hypothetical protein
MQLSTSLRSIVVCLFMACGAGGGVAQTANCVDLCDEAQDGNCTSVTGNCSAFCDALDAVESPANCTSQRDSYQSCLDRGVDVCDTACDSQESALSNCLANYCVTRQSDPDCVTLIGSF